MRKRKKDMHDGSEKRIEGNTDLGVDVLSSDRERRIRSHGRKGSRKEETIGGKRRARRERGRSRKGRVIMIVMMMTMKKK